MARICREAGARVATHVALRDLNLDVPASDGRRKEVVANGLPLWQGAQVAVDATPVSPVRRDGQPRPRADQQPGLALAQAVDPQTPDLPRTEASPALPAGRLRRRGRRTHQPDHAHLPATAREGAGPPKSAVVRGRGAASHDAPPPCARCLSCPLKGPVTQRTAFKSH